MKRTLILGLFALGACATQPNEIATSYVSPLQYQSYDCDQITMEMARLNRRVNELHGSLKKTADDDEGQMAIGLILFWPALFFLDGSDGPQAQEYGRLKGERDALEQAAVGKKCMIKSVQQPTAEKAESSGS
ncbi:MAG: metal ABC transporter ATP-binding protein [Rhodospirillaceae bacterium]|nr:MAG: metal ABC transporter ATP-binding protein [Rhodospirillaceae bacterium]